MPQKTILAADIGGTKTLIQLSIIKTDGTREHLKLKRYISAEYNSLDDIISHYLSYIQIDRSIMNHIKACFAVAGPVTTDGLNASVTNLPWEISSIKTGQKFGFASTQLINDFQAMGYGIDTLSSEHLLCLQMGKPQSGGAKLVVGAGTGFGVGQLFKQGAHYQPMATEGGHTDFAPTDSLQFDLLCFLQKKWGHVSVERLLSGHGLCNIHAFITQSGIAPVTPGLGQEINPMDPAAAIASQARVGLDDAASLSMQLFVKLYGAAVGNLALLTLASGGVYITGGIAAKNTEHMCHQNDFIRAFLDKGRMKKLLSTLPVYIVTDQESGLRGAVRAAELVQDTLRIRD